MGVRDRGRYLPYGVGRPSSRAYAKLEHTEKAALASGRVMPVRWESAKRRSFRRVSAAPTSSQKGCLGRVGVGFGLGSLKSRLPWDVTPRVLARALRCWIA